MHQRKISIFVGLLLIGVLLVPGSHGTDLDFPLPSLPFKLEFGKAKTRVGIAQVTLHVSRLTVLTDRIVGHYELKIPLAPMMNDRGTVEIMLDQPLDRAIDAGKALEGRGDSSEDGRRHGIRCALRKDGKAEIRVDTGDRVLDFRADYSLTR